MADGSSWDSVLQSGIGFAIVLLPIFIGYILNERSKVRAFEREKRYDKKRQTYEIALSSLRRMWDAASAGEMLLTLGHEQIEQRYGKEAAEGIKAFARLAAGIFIFSRFGDEYPDALFQIPPEDTDPEALQKITQEFAQRATLLSMRTSQKANVDLENALASMRLSGVPKTILTHTRMLSDYQECKANHPDGLEGWFEGRVQALESMMERDLRDTITKPKQGQFRFGHMKM